MEQALTDVLLRRESVASVSGKQAVHCEALIITTGAAPAFIDITEDVRRIVKDSGVRFGQVAVFSTHTTAAIKLNEHEPLLLQDMARILHELAPRHAEYEHNDFSRRTVNIEDGECKNGHAHCQHLFLGTSETIPVIEGDLVTGHWQRLFLIELDQPRERRVLVNVVGIAG